MPLKYDLSKGWIPRDDSLNFLREKMSGPALSPLRWAYREVTW